MQTSDNEPHNQTDNSDIISDDSDNIPNMDDEDGEIDWDSCHASEKHHTSIFTYLYKPNE